MMNKSGQGSIADTLTEYETLKLKMKHKSRMFQPSKVLIINKLKHRNET